MPKAAPKRPRPTPEHVFTTDEIQDSLTTAIITLTRSQLLQGWQARHGAKYREFASELVSALMDDILLSDPRPDGTRQLLMEPPAVALMLLSSSLYVLLHYAIDPSEHKDTLVTQILKGVPQ